MRKDYEAKHHVAEENHCWYKARRDILMKLLQKYPRNSKILDVGCSGGPLISDLNKIGFNHIHGIDISEEAVNLCQARGLQNIYLSRAEKIDFRDAEFDIVIASDILEHIKDEGIALTEWRRLLKSGGTLIVFVPAFNFLWSSHDEINNHFRRYTSHMLTTALRKAGFMIERSSYWNFFLFFPTFVIRMLKKMTDRLTHKKEKDDQLRTLNPPLDSLVFKMLKLENAVIKNVNIPLGVSVFAVAKK